MSQIKNEDNYAYYRNRRIPSWWAQYLPAERNPYKTDDTLTLEKGCLAEYWHIHSSNKHPNYNGVEACNMVHSLIREKFGGSFLSGGYWYGGRRGEIIYHEPEHLIYENAYLGEDGKIHIKNARAYYEDVIRFVLDVLRKISRNHMQSGSSYEASEFFPYATDREIEKNRLESEKRKENTRILKEKLHERVQDSSFILDVMECEKPAFNAAYYWDDGWFNTGFKFSELKTNLVLGEEQIKIFIQFPQLFHADSKKKNISQATKELQISYCFYLSSDATKDANGVTEAIPEEKVSKRVKDKINILCNASMKAYNKDHVEAVHTTNCASMEKRYPYNIFLDNKIGRLNLVYDEQILSDDWWRRRFF